MISYKESQSILREIARHAAPSGTDEISLEESVGRILAEDLTTTESYPPFDNSAMDGYALKLARLDSRQMEGADWIPVAGVIAAGESAEYPQAVAVEIMTGAPLPRPDFSTVIRIEDTESRTGPGGLKEIRFKKVPKINENIRRRGEDMREGHRILESGTLIRENHLLAMAAQGISKLKVRKKIKISIISTGKELVDHRTKSPAAGQIRNSTGVYLAAALKKSWSEVTNWGITPDDGRSYRDTLVQAFDREADVVVSTGAVSMGIFDFVRSVLEEMGAQIHFHKCAIRPGKPILFSTITYAGKVRYIFGVPGNPVSTAVGYKFFIEPFLNAALNICPPPPFEMPLSRTVKKPDGLRCFFKAQVIGDGSARQAEVMEGQASFMVSPLARANAWAVLPEEGALVESGRQVEVFQI